MEESALHLWVNSSLKMQFLRVSWRKNTKIFCCGAILLSVVHQTFIEVSLFQETSLPRKNPGCAPGFLTLKEQSA